jgi:hypothetical protein
MDVLDDSVLLSLRELQLIQQVRELEQAQRAYEAEQTRARRDREERLAAEEAARARDRALEEVYRRHAEALRHAEEARAESARRVREECAREAEARRAGVARAHGEEMRRIAELGRRTRRRGVLRAAASVALAGLCVLGSVVGVSLHAVHEGESRVASLEREARVAERSSREATERLRATERAIARANAITPQRTTLVTTTRTHRAGQWARRAMMNAHLAMHARSRASSPAKRDGDGDVASNAFDDLR